MKEDLKLIKKLQTVNESLTDYAMPLFIVGDSDILFAGKEATIVSAAAPKEDFAIIGGRVPNWVREVLGKAEKEQNILIIKDMERIPLEEQAKLLNILKHNSISSTILPENLKIVLLAKEKCDIMANIIDLVEHYEI